MEGGQCLSDSIVWEEASIALNGILYASAAGSSVFCVRNDLKLLSQAPLDGVSAPEVRGVNLGYYCI